MGANSRQMTPPVTRKPAWSKPKITDIGNSPHIPQETFILDEFVKPPGSVWGAETKASALQATKWPGLLCSCSSPGAASLVLHVWLTTVQGEGKANARQHDEGLAVLSPWVQRQAVAARPGRVKHRRAGSLFYENWVDDSFLSTDKMSLVIHAHLHYQML